MDVLVLFRDFLGIFWAFLEDFSRIFRKFNYIFGILWDALRFLGIL